MFLSKGIIRPELYSKKINLVSWKREDCFMTTTCSVSTKNTAFINVNIITSNINIVSRAGVRSMKHSAHIARLLTVLQKIALLIYYQDDFSIYFLNVRCLPK